MGIGADGESPEGGRSPDGQPHGERKEPRAELLGFRNRLIVAVLFAAAYIATFGPRTGFLPGVISGVLGGVVIFLLLKEVDARRKRRHR